MKRILLLMTLALMLAAAMALSGMAQAKTTIGGSAEAQCAKLAIKTLGKGFNPSGYTFIVGTEGEDDFTRAATTGPDVFCGFGGFDRIDTLDEGDIFLGGDGNDGVNNNYGTFYGGAGPDVVGNNYGTFNGGESADTSSLNYGTFYGDVGDDYVSYNFTDGTFYGGSGNDQAVYNLGTFYGEEGNDVVFLNYSTFNGGVGTDTVGVNEGGTLVDVE